MLLLPAIAASAYDFVAEGLYYDISCESTREVKVTNCEIYSGPIVIPATVSHDGKEYTVTGIGNGAFLDYTEVTSFTLPATLRSIGGNAFQGTTTLSSIDIPDGVSYIGPWAFSSSGVAAVKLPKSITTINVCTFFACDNLTSIDIPESVESIEDGALVCNNLSSITIPPSVKEIHTALSMDSRSYTDVYISDLEAWLRTRIVSCDWGPFMMGRLFCNGVELTDLEIPEGVTRIPDYAFYMCKSVKTLRLPESLKEIGHSAFEGCKIKTVRIPDGVEKIGRAAFAGNDLDTLVLAGNVAEISRDAFTRADNVRCLSNTPPNLSYQSFGDTKQLYVPRGSLAAYRSAPGWCTFSNISEFDAGQCARPSIVYADGTLRMESATEGVRYLYAATADDATCGMTYSPDGVIPLAATCGVKLRATRDDCISSSEVVTRLSLRDGSIDGVMSAARRRGVSVTDTDGHITLSGLADGESVEFLTPDGTGLSRQRAAAGSASLVSDVKAVLARIGDETITVR